jgi:hypothetical protein
MTTATSGTQTLKTTFTAGDQLPEIVGQLKGINLTGYTITLHVQRPAPSTVLIKTATVLDAALGKFKFTWGSGDLVEGSNQLCEIQFVTGGKPLTSKKFLIDVVAQIA